MSFEFDTKDLAPEERFEAFAAVASRTYVRHRCSTQSPTQFSSSVSARSLGGIKLVKIFTNGMLATRTSVDCRSAAPDVVHLRRVVSGYAIVAQDDRVAEFTAGQMYLVDPCRPFALASAALHEDLEVARADLEVRIGPVKNLIGRAIPGTTGYAQILQGFSHSLHHRLSNPDAVEPDIIAQQTVDLAALAVRPHSAASASLASQATIRRMRLHQVIGASLASTGITPEEVAGRAGLSLTQANALLAEEGTTLIHELLYQRLEGFRSALTGRQTAREPVRDVMLRFGFTWYPQLEQDFRQLYGVSPIDYRAQVLRSHGEVSPGVTVRAKRRRRSAFDSLF